MPGDDEPAGAVPGVQAGRLDLPQRVAQVLGDREDVGQLVGDVDPRDRLAVEREALGGGHRLAFLPLASSERDRPVGQLGAAGRLACRGVRTLRAPTVTPSPSTAPPRHDRALADAHARRRRCSPAACSRRRSRRRCRTTERSIFAPSPTVTPSPSTTRLPTWAPSAIRQPRSTTRRRDDPAGRLDVVGDGHEARAEPLGHGGLHVALEDVEGAPGGSARASRCRASSASAAKRVEARRRRAAARSRARSRRCGRAGSGRARERSST